MYYDFLMSCSWITLVLSMMLSFLIGILVQTENYFSAEFEEDEVDEMTEPNGPRCLPIIGSLHSLIGYKSPYEAFSALSSKYGEVFKIKLGSTPCVVVNGLDNIREVLMAKGDHFDGRPNIARYNLMFNGDKRNSLAFCDWSDMHKARRELLRHHAVPHSCSSKFDELNTHIDAEMTTMFTRIDTALANSEAHEPLAFKPLLLGTCANIFFLHFASKRYDYGDNSFKMMTYYFDKIFYEVNQGYLVDFLPWLLPLFYRRHFDEISKWHHYVHGFVSKIVEERWTQWKPGKESGDYIDMQIETMRNNPNTEINKEIATYSLSDIIGGHSAVGNFLMKVFAYIVTRPNVQMKIKEEIQNTTKGCRRITLTDKKVMPYTESVILETMRLITSPIVPHVANQNSSIAGFKVKKGTMIFFNNYNLNRDPKLWQKPQEFCPERFLNSNGALVKPDHFLPFGTGRRSCMGYKLVQLLSFSIVTLTLQKYTIFPVKGCSYEVPIGDLALPHETYEFEFK